MNSRLFLLSAAAVGVLVAAGESQEVRPLGRAEQLKIDGFASGDPLGKQPLSAGDDVPVLRAQKPPPKKEKGPTEITALKLYFESETNHAIFTGEVVVKDPEFNLQCDKLTAILKDKGKGKPGTERPAADPPPANPSPASPPEKPGTAPQTGGLQRAIAEGNVFITQTKVELDGSTSENTGKSEKAVYDAVTGEITLSGRPEATHGVNRVIAEEPSTRLIFTRDGKMRTEGKAKYILQDAPEKKTSEKKR